MPAVSAIDVHAHILAEDTIAAMHRAAPDVGLKIERASDEFATLEVAGLVYKDFPLGGFDLKARLADMGKAGFDLQVLSNTPQTFLYQLDTAVTQRLCVIQNDAIAATVAAHPDRFLGLATLPMQAPDLAAAELIRAMDRLGFKGAHLGSSVNGRNLDDPALDPVWAAAHERSAFIMIHPSPSGIAGIERLRSYYLNNLIGNPLETTIAAASLVFGGVIERFPNIKFLMVHGGGFVPYQSGRFDHGYIVRGEPKLRLKQPPKASLEKLVFDTLLHDRANLEFLVGRAGAGRVFLGSDYPFDMGTLEGVRQVAALAVDDAAKQAILVDNARAALKL